MFCNREELSRWLRSYNLIEDHVCNNGGLKLHFDWKEWLDLSCCYFYSQDKLEETPDHN